MCLRRAGVGTAFMLSTLLLTDVLMTEALAQASLFRPEPGTAPAPAPPSGIVAWLAAQQSAFYRLLIDALAGFRDRPDAGLWLVAASFAYGLFHAAGPGHGKAVLASYMLASRAAARRGILLALASSLAQGLTAFAAVGMLVIVLNTTGARITESVWTLERASFAILTAFGLWLLWSRGLRPMLAGEPVYRHDHVHGSDCGHAHMPDAAAMERPVAWREAAGIVASIGMRPCSGAIIVLVFALSQKMLWAGVLSVAAISLGTAVIVALVVLAATAGRGALFRAAAGGSRGAPFAHRTIEVVGALMVFGFGMVLLIGSFGPRPSLF